MAGESGGFWQLERVNRRRTAALVAKLILVLAVIGLGLDFLFHTVRFSGGQLSGFPWFAAVAVILAVAQTLRANFAGAELVLGAMGAHPIEADEPKNQAVIDVVHEIALAARIPAPLIDLIDDPSPNAFAIGRDSAHSKICVTQGLLDQMDREELQGVIGHEMAHIRNCDVRLTTMVTAMFGGFGVLSGRLISIMLSREREYLADASAVEFTRNPTALIRALEQIAKTESPLRCATPGTAQLFIVDPFERADSGRSYQEFINEVTRIRSQSGKTEEQRDEEARNFAAHEYPRNLIVQAVSSHPPLRDRLARLHALIGAGPGAAPASELTDDQQRAKFSDSARFVQNAASTDPEVLAKVIQSALIALPAGRKLLRDTIGGNEGEDSSLPSALAADPASGIALPDSAAQEELQREALAKMLAPVAASMRPKEVAPRPATTERPTGSRGALLFWIVIALSAGAIVAALATK
jgi:heat shock protein HtpX